MSVLEASVHVDGGAKPFGELTQLEVVARAAELRAAVGFGPMARVASVARAWTELQEEMERAGARTVAEVDPAVVERLAEPLWVVAPL